MLFFKYLEKHTYEVLKILAQFFAYTLFQIFKKAYLQNLKKPSTIFLFIPFFKYLKKHTYKILKNLAQFFWLYPSSNIKKSIFPNLKKNEAQFFFLLPFFQIFKYLRQFFKYLKKHTCKSQNTFFILIIILKETIYIKTIIQIISIKKPS